MGTVISLEEKLKKRKEDTIANIDLLDKEIKRINSIRKSVSLNKNEMLYLIETLTCYLHCIPMMLEEEIGHILSEGIEELEIVIDYSKIETVCIVNIINKLMHNFFSLDNKYEYKVKISFNDITACVKVLEDFIYYENDFEELHRSLYYKKDYSIAKESEKVLKYLYAIFRENYIKLSPFEFEFSEEFKKTESYIYMKKNRENYNEIVKYYKDEYIKEYKSKVILIYEGVYKYDVDNNYKNNRYMQFYIKGTRGLNRKLTKYKKEVNIHKGFKYFNKDMTQTNQSSLKTIAKGISCEVGWRILIPEFIIDKYGYSEKNEEKIYIDNTNMYIEEYLKTVKELNGFEVEVICEADLEKLNNSIKQRVKLINENLEKAICAYSLSKYFKDDCKIIDKMESIIQLFC